MATYASDTGGGKDFDPVPEGSHLAVCDMFVDLGMQDSRFGAKHKIYLRWQITSLRVEFEKKRAFVEDVAKSAAGRKIAVVTKEG